MTGEEVNAGVGHKIERQTWVSEYEVYDLVDGELECVDTEPRGPVETLQTFECSCGRRFRKEETAAEHLRTVRENTEPELVTDGGRVESAIGQPTAKWICGGCAKVVSSRPFGPCADCDGSFRRATEADLSCDRCGDADGRRLLDRTGDYERLCQSCIEEVNDGE